MIQLLQMNGEDLKQWWVNLFFVKTYASEIQFFSSHRIEHNDENKILNGYHMSEINHFLYFNVNLHVNKLFWKRKMVG
jgi:hypothetical protein